MDQLEHVRPSGSVRTGSAGRGSRAASTDDGPARSMDGASDDLVVRDKPTAAPRPPSPLSDAVPSTAPVDLPSGRDYPIEAGLPHPRWLPEPSEHAAATRRVYATESRAVIAVIGLFLLAAFLLGMTIFYPVSPLGH